MSARRRKLGRPGRKDFPPMPDGLDFYAHLLFGPDNEEHEEQLRQEWESVGRKFFMHPGFIAAHPGIRAMSFWRWDWTREDHPEAADCRCQAECIVRFDLCDEHERKLIIEGNLVAQQLGLYCPVVH